MTFAQRRNRLTTNFSERILIVKRCISVYTAIHTDYCTASSGRQTTASKVRHSWRTNCIVLGRRRSQPNRSTVPAFAEDGEEQQEKLVKTADVSSRYKPGNIRRPCTTDTPHMLGAWRYWSMYSGHWHNPTLKEGPISTPVNETDEIS